VKWCVVIVAVTLTGSALGQAQEAPESTKPRAEVLISAPRRRSHVGDPLTFALEIKNVGRAPFYVTKAIQAFNYLGGFEVTVRPPPDARVTGGAAAGDFAGKVDIMAAENFILLVPGATYGGTVNAISVPQSPGIYRVVGRRVPILVSDNEKRKLRGSLKFPLLVETVESIPISIVVSK
jgi:hypothetical protein